MIDHPHFKIGTKEDIYDRLIGLLSHALSSSVRNTVSVGTLKREILQGEGGLCCPNMQMNRIT